MLLHGALADSVFYFSSVLGVAVVFCLCLFMCLLCWVLCYWFVGWLGSLCYCVAFA